MIASVGTLGATSDKNSSTDGIDLAVPRTVPVDAIVVVWVAWDSFFSVFTPTSGWNGYKVTDSVGNIYTNIAAGTDTSAFFNSGAYGGVYVAQLRNQLTDTDVIHVQSGEAGTLVAKCVSAWEFEIGAGMRWARSGPEYSHNEIRSAEPPAITFDTTYTRQWLFLHCLGAEAPSTDSYTWDANYTEIDVAGTTGGAADSNVTVLGGWRIANLSSDTVDITTNTADRDYTQLLCAICEVSQRPYPENPVLDDFNRANENPLDNGTWNTTDHAFFTGFAQLVSNEAQGVGGSFWDTIYEDCVEVYMTITDYVGWSAVTFHGEGDSDTATMDGYELAWYATDPPRAPIGGKYMRMGRAGNTGVAEGEMYIWADGFDGAKFGQQRTLDTTTGQPTHHLWLDIGEGWEEIAAYFYPGFQGFPLTSGKLALAFVSTSSHGDDFGGGQIECERVRRPQILRYR